MTTKDNSCAESDKRFVADNVDNQFNNLSEENKSTQKAIANLRTEFNDFSTKVSSLEKLLLKCLKEGSCY